MLATEAKDGRTFFQSVLIHNWESPQWVAMSSWRVGLPYIAPAHVVNAEYSTGSSLRIYVGQADA